MYKAIIVDDEASSRVLVESLGRWSDHGIEIIGYAGDGKQAAGLLRHMKPDLLVLDMNMPHMSGAELLQAIGSLPARPKVIVISGYEDFSYARISLGYGAIAYLLKPLDRDELNGALERFVALMEREKTLKKGEAGEMEQFNAQLTHCLLRPERRDMLTQLCAEARISAWEMMTLAIPGENGADTPDLGTPGRVRVLHIQPGYAVYGILAQPGRAGDSALEWCKSRLEARYPGRILWGGRESGLVCEELQQGFQRSMNRLNAHNLLAKDEGRRIQGEGLGLKEAIQLGRFESITETVTGYISQCAQSGRLTIGEALRFLDRVMSTVEAFCWNNGIQQEPPDVTGLLEDVAYTFSPKPVFAAMGRIAEVYRDFLQAAEKGLTKDTLALIKEYVDENLKQGLTLQGIADRFYLSKEYISRAFKARYHQNLTDYIHLQKCQRAKRMLAHHSVKTVAEQLGYEDVSYFSRVYKKYMGTSPGSVTGGRG